MKFLAFIASLLIFAAPVLADNAPVPDGKPHQFTLHDGQFWVDGTPIRILAGEMHPGRIRPEFWDQRIKQAKAMGLNTISIYLFWNQIEPTEGNFVFKDQTDIRHFAQLCQDNGMWLIVRAGPYVCAEIEFGGFPAWMLKHPGLQIRTNEPQYMGYCKTYIQQIGGQLADMQVGHGGPIIMVQVENELHRIDDYLRALKDDFVAAGFDGQLMTCDPSGQPWTTVEGIPNVLRGYNGFSNDNSFAMRYNQITAVDKPTGYPIYSPEVYTGWFATFGTWGPSKSPKVAVDRQVAQEQFLMDHKDVSWCLYLFNGGTNFGFTSGANNNHPMQTSYDYDAPIDELGRVTAKYKALRDVYQKGMNLTLPPIPPDPAVIEIPKFTMSLQSPLLARLPAKSVDSDNVLSMEDIDQNFGFVDYRKTFDAGLKGTLDAGPPRDYVSIMVNGKVVSEAFNGFRPAVNAIAKLDEPGPCTLDILVHNLGRNSLITSIAGQRKGLTANPTLDGTAITGWKIYSMPLDDPDQLPAATNAATGTPTGPTFFTGSFTLNDLGETYLDMSNWHFGVVWVNGHNLGRFWDVGTSRAIYLPSVWQNKGENQITVLELGPAPTTPEITGVANMVETSAKRAAPLWATPTTQP